MMRWPSLFRRRPAPSLAVNLVAVAEDAFAAGALAGTECERARCKAILQSPAADLNRPAAEVLTFATDMAAAAAVRLITELANLDAAQSRSGPVADHYTQAARTITERKFNE